MKIKYNYKKIVSDTITPVGAYLALRDRFVNAIMLESSDYHGEEHNFSYICLDRIGGLEVHAGNLVADLPGKPIANTSLETTSLADAISQYLNEIEEEPIDLPFMHGGLFGYITYDAVQHFEDLCLTQDDPGIPLLQYGIYRFVLAFNHFNNELFIIEATSDDFSDAEVNLGDLITIVKLPVSALFTFNKEGGRSSNCTDEEFMKMVERGVHHCQRGDVFQIVMSRAFEQGFKGDEFNVYRALRSINPSPYLFYFDYGSFKLFGSSPEAQLIIKGDKVTIHPIAGTFRRTGNDERDAELARELIKDPKENAEHVMLVDLARNDLSRNGKDVKVEVYREVQYYSHVIHLVSKVTSTFHEGANKVKVIGDTFPAGTLSGAPKYRAMQLIDQYEKTSRSFYGGAIGHLNYNGDFNHAIMIRTFMSRSNKLKYQAGAGVVVDSKKESELQEVDNKLMALNKAILLAEEL
ncbi:MAG: anthranilate synthase component I family protein [Bacteroidetes bacterium]|nr:anthranilate synthase component I family protein [Bacteroidota bacterium]